MSRRKSGSFLEASQAIAALLVSGCACGQRTATDGGYVCQAPDASSLPDGSVGCQADPNVAPYCPGMKQDGTNHQLTFELVSSDPQPPAVSENNAWTVKILDTSGSAVTTDTLCVYAYMPYMGHGASLTANAALQSDGTWQISPLELFMPGVWRVSFAVCPPGGSCAPTAGQQLAQCAAGTAPVDTGAFWFCVN